MTEEIDEEAIPWKQLFKLLALTFGGFLVIAAIGGIFGVSNREMILDWINTLASHPVQFGAAVILVLTVDSLFAIPTMATAILTGHVLGPLAGGLVTTIGIASAGTFCYSVARFGGRRFIPAHLASPLERAARKYGIYAFLACRTIPMMPEALSAMAGVSRLPYFRFLGIFVLSNAPFAFVGAWAGSISTVDSPWPGIITGLAPPTLGVILLIWLRWKRRGAPSSPRTS